MTYEKCEMCLQKKRGVHEGQCMLCHAETCDMPLDECIAKQQLYKKLNWMDRLCYFDEDEIREAKRERVI